jgi:cyclin-dependent kinase 12/13
MGCVCSRDSITGIHEDFSFSRAMMQCSKRKPSGSARFDGEEIITNGISISKIEVEKENADEKKINGIAMMTNCELNFEMKEKQCKPTMDTHPRPRNPPNHIEGEQIAAGWPAWLSNVAKEAINGWIPRRADSFEKLDKVILCQCDFSTFSKLESSLSCICGQMFWLW